MYVYIYMAVSILYPSRRFGLGRRPGQGFTYQIENCLQMRHGFDNMFQNAFKCDMVSPTCSKMPSNATWFRQQVPKCSQMRHGFDNKFQNALKCDVVSPTSSKMLSNATWFRQHVPKCSQMRRGFEGLAQGCCLS